MSQKKITKDPFEELQSYHKRIPGQEEAVIRRQRTREQNRLYGEHVRAQLKNKFVSSDEAMPLSKALLAAGITFAGSVVFAVVIFVILFGSFKYLPSSVDEFIVNFDAVANTGAYVNSASKYPDLPNYSLAGITRLPDKDNPIYFNDGQFYLYAETKGDRIISVTAGATESYTGFNKELGGFVSDEDKGHYNLFLMRTLYALDKNFETDVNGCAGVISMLHLRTDSGFSDYVYKGRYIITFDLTDSLYFHAERTQRNVAMWKDSAEEAA